MTGRVTRPRSRSAASRCRPTRASSCCWARPTAIRRSMPIPTRLDVGRQNIRPMSFGGGIHHCLGAQLARLEAELVFTALVERLPNLELPEKDTPALAAELHPARPDTSSRRSGTRGGYGGTVAGRGRPASGCPPVSGRQLGAEARLPTARCWPCWPTAWAAMPAARSRSRLAVEAFVHGRIEGGGSLADGACTPPTRRSATAPSPGIRRSTAWAPPWSASIVGARDEVRWISVGDSPILPGVGRPARAIERGSFDGAADRGSGGARHV